MVEQDLQSNIQIGHNNRNLLGYASPSNNTYALGYSQSRLISANIKKRGVMAVSGRKGGRSKRNIRQEIAFPIGG